MTLTDENLLIMAMYIFVFVFLFALGIRKWPGFLVLSGIIAIVLGIEIGNLTRASMANASLILTTIMAFIGIMMIVWGFTLRTDNIST